MAKYYKVLIIALFGFSVLFLSKSELISFGGSAPNPPSPRICFELDVWDCPNAVNASLKVERFDLVFHNYGNSSWEEEVVFDTKTEPYQQITEKYVVGFKYGCYFTARKNKAESYRDLFYFANNRWPTPTELANISQTDAENWFRTKHKNPCSGKGEQYAHVSNGLEYRTKGGPVCFDYPDPLLYWDDIKKKTMPFNLEVVFPNGSKCKIEQVLFASAASPKNGEKITTRVRIIKPCAGCNS
jgi:hypothetical protein